MTERTQLTCMNTLVDLQVLGSRKELPAAGEGTRERLLPSVDPDVVDQLVLGFERSLLSGTTSPVAGIVCHLRTANMVDGQVAHHLVHGVVDLLAELPGVPVHPLTGHLLLDRLLPHVPVVGGHVAVTHVAVAVVAGGGSHKGGTVSVCGNGCGRKGREHGMVGSLPED